MVMSYWWLHVATKVLAILEKRHPEKYAAMGKPSDLMSSWAKGRSEFLLFFYCFQWKELEDPELSKLGRLLWIIFSLQISVAISFFIWLSKT